MTLTEGRAPGAWPLLGHFNALRRHPLRFLDTVASQGDLVEFRIGPRRAFMLCHPDLAYQVLTDLRTFDRTGMLYGRVRGAMGNGLATAAYHDHRRQRLIMQPAFRREHLRGYAVVMSREATALMDRWRDGDRVDMVDEMFQLTTSVALRTLFSSRIEDGQAERLRDAFDVFLRGVYTRLAFPGVEHLPTPGSRRYRAALAQWRGQVRALIEGYRSAGVEHGDLMSRLLAARDEQGSGMTDEELSDQVAVLLLAGGETTSAALAWSVHLLGEHPAVLDALTAEVDDVLAGAVATWDHLPRLDLTARAVRETMRLYPPAWLLTRTVTRETELAGRTVRPGTILVFSPYIVHRRADLYPRPDRFDPDRWLDSTAARGSYLPFGAGATKCIGDEFGTAEATLTLASLVSRWRLTPHPTTAPFPAARLVLVPHALPVTLNSRSA